MLWNAHSKLIGEHAFLSPSNYHWVNYSDQKLVETYWNRQEARRGSELHALAASLIKMGVKLPRTGATLNRYVNDAIGHKMNPEQTLFYSFNAFGTCDAISFHNNLLRIHDLKTGVTPASMMQLKVYAALFCLEYRHKPKNIAMELRIYINDNVEVLVPDAEDIHRIMDVIVDFDKKIDAIKQ